MINLAKMFQAQQASTMIEKRSFSKDDAKGFDDCEIGKKRILPNKTLRASIYVHVSASEPFQRLIVRKKLEDKELIQKNGWLYTDMFLAKEDNNVLSLVLERARSGAFDLIVAAVDICREYPVPHLGRLMIMGVCDAKLFALKGGKAN